MHLNDRAESFGRLLQMTEVPLFHRSQRAGAGESVGAGEKGKIVQQRDTHTTHVRMYFTSVEWVSTQHTCR